MKLKFDGEIEGGGPKDKYGFGGQHNGVEVTWVSSAGLTAPSLDLFPLETLRLVGERRTLSSTRFFWIWK